MVRLDAVFAAADGNTPELAARLARHAERYRADVSLECAEKRLSLDSLIGILALEMHRGDSVAVIAEGEDAQQAAEEIRAVLQGER